MLIKVTQEDLAAGTPRDADHCALAHAIRRQTGVITSVSYPRIYKRESMQSILTPPHLRYILQQYDNGRYTAPFTVEIPNHLFAKLM